MIDEVKTRFKKTMKFVEDNQTLVVCGVTAVVASKLSYDVGAKMATSKFYSDDGDFYKLLITLAATWDFMERKGLSEQEYVEFIKAERL